jgi:hypothetical protein
MRFDSLMAAGDSAGVLALLADDAVILEAGGLETAPSSGASIFRPTSPMPGPPKDSRDRSWSGCEAMWRGRAP